METHSPQQGTLSRQEVRSVTVSIVAVDAEKSAVSVQYPKFQHPKTVYFRDSEIDAAALSARLSMMQPGQQWTLAVHCAPVKSGNGDYWVIRQSEFDAMQLQGAAQATENPNWHEGSQETTKSRPILRDLEQEAIAIGRITLERRPDLAKNIDEFTGYLRHLINAAEEVVERLRKEQLDEVVDVPTAAAYLLRMNASGWPEAIANASTFITAAAHQAGAR